MWGETREGEGNQTPKFPFSIKRKISKNLGLSSKVYNFFDFCEGVKFSVSMGKNLL